MGQSISVSLRPWIGNWVQIKYPARLGHRMLTAVISMCFDNGSLDRPQLFKTQAKLTVTNRGGKCGLLRQYVGNTVGVAFPTVGHGLNWRLMPGSAVNLLLIVCAEASY